MILSHYFLASKETQLGTLSTDFLFRSSCVILNVCKINNSFGFITLSYLCDHKDHVMSLNELCFLPYHRKVAFCKISKRL